MNKWDTVLNYVSFSFANSDNEDYGKFLFLHLRTIKLVSSLGERPSLGVGPYLGMYPFLGVGPYQGVSILLGCTDSSGEYSS